MQRLLLILMISLLSWTQLSAKELRTEAEYVGTTADTFTVSWNAVPSCNTTCVYKWRLMSEEYGQKMREGTTTGTFVSLIGLPKVGHYWFEVQACHSGQVNSQDTELCSEFADSRSEDDTVINGQPHGWRLFGWIAPFGGIE